MKKVCELSVEELTAVFEANNKLREEVAEDYEESQMDYISDILSDLRSGLSDWEVGFCSYPVVRYSNEADLFRAALESCENYGFLPDDTAEKIKYYLSRCDALDGMEYENRHYDELEEYIERAGKEVAEEIETCFKQLTDYSESDLTDYFCEFYASERLPESCYVDGNNLLWEHVEYEKCYASQTKKRAAC